MEATLAPFSPNPVVLLTPNFPEFGEPDGQEAAAPQNESRTDIGVH